MMHFLIHTLPTQYIPIYEPSRLCNISPLAAPVVDAAAKIAKTSAPSGFLEGGISAALYSEHGSRKLGKVVKTHTDSWHCPDRFNPIRNGLVVVSTN